MRRGVLTLAVVVLLAVGGVIAVSGAAAAADFVDVAADDLPGNGTSDDPYEISNASELQAIGDNLSAHYELVDDVDASGTSGWNNGSGFEPIASSSTPFTGTLEGNNHTISALTIDRPAERDAGLFGGSGVQPDSGTVRNVTLESVDSISAQNDTLTDTATETLTQTVYVDETADPGTADGTPSNPYASVQNGVENASAGETVLVEPGTYGESVTVDKPLTIVTNGSVTLDGSNIDDFGIEVTASDVTVDGFRIDGYTAGIEAVEVSNLTVSNVTVSNSASQGIALTNVSQGAIQDSRIEHSNLEGVLLRNSDNVTVQRNNIVTSLQNTSALDSRQFAPAGGSAPVDLVLVIDMSGSMGSGSVDSGESFMEAAKYGAKQAVGELGADGRAAVVGFNSAADRKIGLSDDKTAVIQAIDSLQDGGGTDMATGISEANAILDTQARSGSNRATIVLGDGYASGIDEANTTKQKHDARIQTIALGTSADESTLKKIASSEDDYLQTNNISELSDAFSGFASDVQGIRPAGVRLLSATAQNNLLYDNYLNNGNNVDTVSAGENEWNVSKQTGTNIINSVGETIGGNFYATPDGTGVSQACTNDDLDAFCDTPVTHNQSNVDQLPLAPVVFNLTATVQTDTEVEIVVDARHELTSLTVGIAEKRLQLADFQKQRNNDGTYTYTSTVSLPIGSSHVAEVLNVNDRTHNTNSDTATIFLPGSGTADDPYNASTVAGLQLLQERPTKEYQLVSDINGSNASELNGGQGFAPIGDFQQPFTGGFDGNGYTISNLTIDRAGEDNVGLFGVSEGAITNTSLAEITVTGSREVGGLVGRNTGIVAASNTTGNITGTRFVGGIVGDSRQGSVTGSYTASNVTGNIYVGGLIGASVSDTIDHSYATGTVGGVENVGGLSGVTVRGTIQASNASGPVTGTKNVGGLVGSNGLRSNSIPGSIIKASNASGTVTVPDGASAAVNIGGLAGENFQGTITTVNATGDVRTDGSATSVGGLVGKSGGSRGLAKVTESYATGAVNGSSEVGGLIGTVVQTVVNQTYATGTVEAGDTAGGLVGTFAGTNLTFSYATGAVTAGSKVGGFAGNNDGSIQNAYWDLDTTGQPDGVGSESSGATTDVTGLATADMTGDKAIANTNLDFTNTWDVLTTTGGSYPYLRANTQEPKPGGQQPATPNLTGLDIAGQGSNATIPEGDEWNVTVNVTNEGGQSRQFSVALSVGGILEKVATDGDLAPGETETLVFENVTGTLADGEYDVVASTETSAGVDRLMGNLTVRVPQPPTPALAALDVAEQGANATIARGDDENVALQVTNVGDQTGSFDVRLDVGDGAVEATISTTNLAPGETEPLLFENVTGAIDLGTHPVNVSAGDDVTEGTLTVERPPAVALSTLAVAGQGANATITGGANESVAVTVTNVGDQAGSFDVNLDIGGAVTMTQSTTKLSDGGTETVRFETVTGDLDPGAYDVAVSAGGDDLTGTLDVRVPPEGGLSGLTVAGQGANATIVDGTETDVAVTVTNGGEVADSFDVTLDVGGGTVRMTQSTRELADGETDTLTFENVTGGLALGEHDVTVSTDEGALRGTLNVVEPPEAAVSNLTIGGQRGTAAVSERANASASIDVENTGQAAGSFTVTLSLGSVQETVSTGAIGSGESETVTVANVTGPLSAGNYTVTATTDNDTTVASLQVLTPAAFELTDVTGGSAAPGEEVTVTATVENVGGATDAKDVELRAGTALSQYADGDGVIRTDGVLSAILQWRNGGISTMRLLDVISAWRSGVDVDGPVLETTQLEVVGGGTGTVTFTDTVTGGDGSAKSYRVRTDGDGALVTVEIE